MIGELVGPYRLIEFIARGEVSFVYKADVPDKGDFFAVKIFRLSPTRDEKMVQDFLLEAERMSSMGHPNILPIYDVGHQEGVYYVATRYVNASSLDQIMDEFQHPRHALTLVRPLASALDYLHDHNVVHANVKPSNILVDGANKPYLTSTGFASRLSGATTYGAYAAPEQEFGVVNQQVDVYALGALMYEMMACEQPLPGKLPILTRIRGDLPEDLDAVLSRAMDPDPEERYESCLELSSSLESAIFPYETETERSRALLQDSQKSEDEELYHLAKAAELEKQKKRQAVRLTAVLTMLFLTISSIIYLVNALISGEGIYAESDVSTVSAIIDANVRSGPGIDYPIIGILREGESTIATGTNQEGDWYAIYHSNELNERAWISSRVIEVDQKIILPIIETSEGDREAWVEIASIVVPRKDVSEIPELAADKVKRETEDNTSYSPSSSAGNANWLPSSIYGLPGVMLLFGSWLPIRRGLSNSALNW